MAVAAKIFWRETPDSSNVEAIGWVARPISQPGNLFVRFRSGDVYMYSNVSQQRFLALKRADSIGTYINRRIIPNYRATKIT